MTSRVACGAGVPHVPAFFQRAVAGDRDVNDRYRRVCCALDDSDASLLIVTASDHINTYFLDRYPTFAISLGDILSGPIEEVPGILAAPLPTDAAAAIHLAESLVAAGFDLMHSRETQVDHGVIVPLQFLNHNRLPVVVLHVNGHVAPLPSARRCHHLGVALARAIEELPGDRRVAVVASGAFSTETGGPRVDEGRAWSVPRPDWAARIARAFAIGDVDTILAEATADMLTSAGSGAGELLSWITMVGAAGSCGAGLQPMIDYRPGESFAFGIWTEEGMPSRVSVRR